MRVTLADIEKRHRDEIRNFRKNCKHERVVVFQGSDTNGGAPTWSLVGSYGKEPVGELFQMKCEICGVPVMSIEHGKLNIFVKPHYISEDAR